MSLFIPLLIQPFFNVLVGAYWLMGFTPIGLDMGVAVILLTLFIRLLLLPITLASDRSEAERREIEEKYQEITQQYSSNPLMREKMTKSLLKGNPRILLAEGTMFLIQVAIALILWWIFANGLGNSESNALLYSFMPEIDLNHEFDFMGYSLDEPHWQFNVVQTILIFLVETVGLASSPHKVRRDEVVRYQVILPAVSFLAFSVLPAGKKLFVITTLSFSLVIMIAKILWRYVHNMLNPPPEKKVPRFREFLKPKSEDEAIGTRVL